MREHIEPYNHGDERKHNSENLICENPCENGIYARFPANIVAYINDWYIPNDKTKLRGLENTAIRTLYEDKYCDDLRKVVYARFERHMTIEECAGIVGINTYDAGEFLKEAFIGITNAIYHKKNKGTFSPIYMGYDD